MTRKNKAQDINFEEALSELNQVVDTMEKGDLSLEQSLQNFERGVTLVKNCQEALKQAELKVQILMQNDSESELKSYSLEDNT
ncbi:MAG: exodeoxyribonuclease VII small subunit [Proteobacteria bacterium]|nr:exodeoxyribonuclease VII small subunit [Pseudomonadota bacterium]